MLFNLHDNYFHLWNIYLILLLLNHGETSWEFLEQLKYDIS